MAPIISAGATIHTAESKDINSLFDEMKKGEIQGRIVMEIARA